jgi:hypothetical protein
MNEFLNCKDKINKISIFGETEKIDESGKN